MAQCRRCLVGNDTIQRKDQLLVRKETQLVYLTDVPTHCCELCGNEEVCNAVANVCNSLLDVIQGLLPRDTIYMVTEGIIDVGHN